MHLLKCIYKMLREPAKSLPSVSCLTSVEIYNSMNVSMSMDSPDGLADNMTEPVKTVLDQDEAQLGSG